MPSRVDSSRTRGQATSGEIAARTSAVRSRLLDPGLLGLDGLRREARGWLALCPWHAEKTPSLHISEQDGRLLLHCFGCGSGGTVLDLVAHRHGLGLTGADFVRVLEHAEGLAGVSTSSGTSSTPKRTPAPAPRQAIDLVERQDVQHRIAEVLLEVAPMGEAGFAFFEARSIRRAEVPGTFALLPPPDAQRRVVDAIVHEIGRDAWVELSGLASRDGRGFTFPLNRLCIPWRAAPGVQGAVGLIQRRRLDSCPPEQRYRSPAEMGRFPLPFGIENLELAGPDDVLVLVEGALDGLALEIIARERGLPWFPLALGSATNWQPEWTELIEDRAVAVGLDRDPTGNREADRLMDEKLAPAGIEAIRLAPTNGKDWGEELELLRRGGVAA